jgi:outer membrane protein TolC
LSIPAVLNNYSLKASLTVPISDYILRLSDSIEATKRNAEAARLNEQAEHQKVEADSRIAFYNWTRGLGQVAVAGKSLERIQARLADARIAFQLGAATKADVLRLEALVASTESSIVQAEAFRDLVSAQLSTFMNDERPSYALGEPIMTTLPPPAGSGDLPGLVSEAEASRLELRSMTESVKALEHSTTVMERGRLPRLDAFGEYAYANPNQRKAFAGAEWTGTWAVGASLTWRVNDTFNNGAIAKELQAQQKGVVAQQQALREGIRLEVTSAYLDDRKARAALDAAQRGAEAARAAYEVATELFRVGRATTAELIDAEAELVGAMLGLVNAYIDMRVARTKLAYATGRSLEVVE